MSCSIWFGLPGAGKSTVIAHFAKKYIDGKKYKNVYTNLDVDIDGVWRITVEDFGTYNIHDGIVLIDEATATGIGNREYKNISRKIVNFFILHRHFRTDVLLFTQRWDGIDKTIRIISDKCFYIWKGMFLGKWFTNYYQVPYDIIIPDPDDGDGEHLGEIVQGYCKPHRLAQIFCHRIYRPNKYKLFDSFEVPYLPPLPVERQYFKARAQKTESEPSLNLGEEAAEG